VTKILLGFMGAGKTTVGRILDPNFHDMDELIVNQIGMSINDTTNHNYYNVAKLPVQYRDLSAQSIKLQIPFCLVLYLSLLSSLGLSWKPRFKELW